MYWKKGNTRTACPMIPFYVSGSNYDFTLTLITESGEALENVFLSVADDAHTGLIQAKLHAASTYQAINGLFDVNCFLGDIAAESETEIDFRLSFSDSTSDGTRYIAVVVQYGMVSSQ